MENLNAVFNFKKCTINPEFIQDADPGFCRGGGEELYKQSEPFVVEFYVGPESFWIFNAQICIISYSLEKVMSFT